MIRYLRIAALACVALLSACGTEHDNPVVDTASKALKDIFTKKAPQQVMTIETVRAQFTPEVLESLKGLAIIAELPSLKIASLFTYAAENGATTTWQAEDGAVLNTKSGMLISSRGLGFDLMSSTIDGPLAVITGRAKGPASRQHRFLNGEDQEVTVSFLCTYTRKKSQVTEVCTSDDLILENQYWLNKDSAIWRSQQWLGTKFGSVFLENL